MLMLDCLMVMLKCPMVKLKRAYMLVLPLLYGQAWITYGQASVAVWSSFPMVKLTNGYA